MKVYLKYNKDPKENPSSLTCLKTWIDIFQPYEISIITDIYDIRNSPPKQFNSFKHLRFINTDYTLSKDLDHLLENKRWGNVASSNFTCYNDSNHEPFWLVDADDTMLLSSNLKDIRNKIKRAEDIFRQDGLQGFSLDFYRTIKRDHWSFGMALLQNFDGMIDILKSTKEEDVRQHKLPLNLDSIFDTNRRSGKINLKSFVFNNYYFQHQLEQKYLPWGIYYWSNGKLWGDTDINDEVIIIE
jgi:hypothetical protein